MGRKRGAVQRRFDDALLRHDMELVIWMIDSGEVHVDAEAANGDSPLLHAVARNQIDVLDLLLDRGVNVNAVNRHGKTALMKAAATTDVDTTDAVSILLRRGADIFARDPSGQTALDWARRTNNVSVARRLELAVQAHIVAHRVTAANQEAAQRHDEIAQTNDALKTQLHALFSPFAPRQMLSLLASAAISQDTYTAAFPHGPPYFVNAESAQGWTALTKAASVDDVDVLRSLLQHGALVDYETKLRHTALTWASYSGHTNAVQVLLQHNAQVEYATREKMTALSHASRNGKTQVVALLLSKCREVFLPLSSQPDYVSNEAREWHTRFLNHVLAEDVSGKSALAYAAAGGHTDVVALLQAACDQARAHETHVQTLEAKTRVVACALGCGTTNAHDLIGYHQAHKCPLRDVACDKCKEHMQSQHLAEHERRTCTYRDVTCVNLQFGCAAVLPWHTMQLHQSDHCHYRSVECRLECGKVLQWHARPHHEASECPQRTISCPACGHPMRGQDLKKHNRSVCPKRLVECKLYGGCGEIHASEDTAFHAESLCSRRKRPCHWVSHGCDAVLGPPEARLIHEETTCPFRTVTCRNGCGVADLIAAFLDEHLAWDCPKEIKHCPLECGLRMEAQFIYGHCEPNCGDCPNRVTRCPYDMCGKKMCFYGDTRWDADETTLARSDVAGVDVTRNGVLARLGHLDTYLNEKVSSFALVQAHAYLCTWLLARKASLLQAYQARDLDRVELGMVVKYDPETTQHYVSFRGRVVWLNLNRVYHALDPAVLATDWLCPSMAATARPDHVATMCPLHSVACPNACGQRCPKFQLEHHLKERCSKRMLVCRLGCHKALTMEALLEHEESECPKSQRFCPHCHAPCLLEALESHVRTLCLQFPRNCRLTCGAQVPRASFEEHEATVCPKRLVPCPRCHTQVFACDLSSHESDECPQRPFGLCELGCGTQLCVNNVQKHVLQECPHRMVPCPQCASSIPCSIFDHHVKLDCPQRQLFCHKGCGTRLRECDVASHDLEDCIHRPTFCPLQCGLELAMSQLPRHMHADCVRRCVACPNRCGAKVPGIQLPGHLRSCDHRKVPCGAGSVACARPLKAWIVRERLVPCLKHRLHGFMWALKCGDMDVMLGFLSKIARDEVDAEFDTGYTPLVLACAKGDVLLVRALLEHGANVNTESSRGRTPLGEAILNKRAHVIPLLLEYRAIVSHVNRHGLSTLSIAEQMGDATILDVLAKRAKLEQDQRRLFVAIGASDYDTIEELVAGGEMTYRDSHGWHLARELEASRDVLARARADLTEHIAIMNATIADTEAKQMRVVHLLDSMEYNKGQLAQVQTKETKLDAVRVHTETTVRDIVRKITAQDIINIISRPNPPEDLVVVLKAMALFQGILPKPKRLNETGAFSTHEWWETAQAMLMDRGFLRRLLDIRELAIEPDVLFKVRRECLKHDAFREIGAAELAVPDVLDAAPAVPKQRHGRRNAITNSTVDALGTWVKGVEINQKARAEAKVLQERRESVLAEIHQLDVELATASFEMKTAHRCLPSRQEELDRVVVLEQRAEAEFHLKTRRVLVCELLAFTSLNGHTPLSYAAAVGNERAVRILLSRGANGGHSDTERSLAAKLLQTAVRFYVQQATYADATRDAEVFRIVRYMTMRPIYKALRRCRQTQRVPLHEAAYNGHTDVLPLLVDVGHAPVWQTSYVEPTAMMPGQIAFGPSRRKDVGLHAWQVVLPLSRLTLDESCRLGQSRFAYMPYRDGRGWDRTASSIYDATINQVAAVVVASHEHQHATRLEQMNRKTILRQTRHMRRLHDQLEAAILAKDYVAASALLDVGAFPDYATPAGMTLLMQAASEDRFLTNKDGAVVLVVEFLLDRKMGRPSLNFISTSLDGSFCHTALSVAAHYGTTMCGRTLVDRGADVNIQDPRFGLTALMHAAQNNKDDFVRFLLEQKASVHLKDVHGRSAFTFATERRNETMLGLLSAAAADMHRTLEIYDRLAVYGLCRWGCGFVELRTAPVVEAGQGLVVAMRNPLQEHELHACPKRVLACPLGCDQPDLWSQEVADHVARECPHRPLPCTHPKCDLMVAASALRQHTQHDCMHRTVACPLCGEGSLAHKLEAHTKCCRLRLVPCPLCANELRALDVINHVKFECGYRDVRCRLGCGFVRLCDRTSHEADVCVKRSIPCVFACVDGTTPETQADHEQICDFRPMVCPNRCGQTVRAIDVDSHLSECSYRFVPCTIGCGRRVRACDMVEHVSGLCTKRAVPCEWCGTQGIVATLLELHQRTECSHRIQACGVCGDGGILALDMTTHKTAKCRMRPVECVFRRDGCMKTPLLAHEKTQHETFECKYRTIWCPLGCNEHLVARHLKTHEAMCPVRFVVCTLGCGAELREKDRFEHEAYACSYNNKK